MSNHDAPTAPPAKAPEGSAGPSEMFSRVDSARTSTTIVARVVSAIHDGELRVGDRLPPERELCAQWGVSRVTVRDALRILEARGLVDVRVGARGGAYVTAPVPDVVRAGITDMMVLQVLSPEEVTQARFVLELGTVQLAARAVDANDLAELEEICDRGEQAVAEGTFGVAESAEFHTRLARAAGNGALSIIFDVFYGPLLESLRRRRGAGPLRGGPILAEHREIIAALRSGDPDKAQAAMHSHLLQTAERIGATPMPVDGTQQPDV